VQYGHYHFGRGSILLLVDVDRDSAAVVYDGNGMVCVEKHGDLGAIASECLVNGIVHDFEDHMMESRAIVGVADVHPGTLANGVQSTKNLDASGIVAHRGEALSSNRAQKKGTPLVQRGEPRILIIGY
jgi:hypothetical protein